MSHEIKTICRSPVFVENQNLWVDCGHCRHCRKKLRYQWTMRMQHELPYHDSKAAFITLTYDDAHLPVCGSVCRRDFQLFVKRLRKRIEDRHIKSFRHLKLCRKDLIAIHPVPKIKLFYSSEYGTRGTKRPHYHAIIFGLNHLQYAEDVYTCWGKCSRSVFFRPLKSGGYAGYSPVRSPRAFNYTAGYTYKKLGKFYNKRFQTEYSRLPEFQGSSIGIGKRYALTMPLKDGKMRHNGRWIIPPRYYRKILKLDGAQYVAEIEKLQSQVIEQACQNSDYIVRYLPSKITVNDYGKYRLVRNGRANLDSYRLYCDNYLMQTQSAWEQKI